MSLSTEGSARLKQFLKEYHQQTGIAAGEQFAATPRMLQTLHDKIVEDGNWFLQRINVMGVPELVGQKLFMHINGLTSTRTNTSEANRKRRARSLHDLDDTEYKLHKTDSDIAIRYSVLDAWKFFNDFAQRYQRLFRSAIGNDRVRVGWHGTTAATNTDPATNPNGEDVNIGWLELARLADNGTGKNVQSGVTVGAGGDFARACSH